MSPAGSTVSEDGGSRRIAGVWGAPLVVLFAVWLWLAFASGGYMPQHWLLPSAVLGFLGLVVSLLGAYPRRPRQLSLAVLGFFGCYCLWVALSALWANSTTRVWLETGRSLNYLLVFLLALVYLTDESARRVFRYLLLAATCVLLVACTWKLWGADNIAALFTEDRLSYPVMYPNNAAALFLIAFWPLMWLAAGPEERAPVRGVALGLATGMLGLAVMTQSRGAIYSLAISLVVMFVLSPARLRTLFYLLVPALLMVYEFPNLNRYWLEGPETVGGGLGGRTLILASVTAAFIGMILALLERWVKVSRRMKAIFGAVVILGIIAGSVYGSVALTRDAGGPVNWVSQAWRQFVGQADGKSESTSSSRFLVLSSSGRMDIWRVAWEEFEGAPILGVGADNFVFQYDRFRTLERMQPQQAHSFELQVLGETGLVGGVFAFGGILSTLLGILWPRCTAGWRGARETWLRRRRSETTSNLGGASVRWCNPRWGNKPAVYGWEMALLTAAIYWFIHASVDWLWQMAGVSIPAMLFAAAAVASVDARGVVLWPRWNRWLKLAEVTSDSERSDMARDKPSADDAPQPSKTGLPTDLSSAGDAQTAFVRRPDPNVAERESRRSRRAEKSGNDDRLQPPGMLSLAIRTLLVALSLILIVVAGLPYLSIQYQQSALALARTDGVRAVERAGAAHWLQPADPDPYLTQAGIYASAASDAAALGTGDRAAAVLDNLALSIDRFDQAIALESVGWSLHYRAGVMALNLLLAQQYASGLNPEFDYAVLVPMVPGLEDWSALLGSDDSLPDPGVATGSLAASPETRAVASYYRRLSQANLASLALEHLSAAEERNPLARRTTAATEIVHEIQGAGLRDGLGSLGDQARRGQNAQYRSGLYVCR